MRMGAIAHPSHSKLLLHSRSPPKYSKCQAKSRKTRLQVQMLLHPQQALTANIKMHTTELESYRSERYR